MHPKAESTCLLHFIFVKNGIVENLKIINIFIVLVEFDHTWVGVFDLCYKLPSFLYFK